MSKMEQLYEVIRNYYRDLEDMPIEKIEEVAEVLDAFMSDYQHEKWNAEAIGYGI